MSSLCGKCYWRTVLEPCPCFSGRDIITGQILKKITLKYFHLHALPVSRPVTGQICRIWSKINGKYAHHFRWYVNIPLSISALDSTFLDLACVQNTTQIYEDKKRDNFPLQQTEICSKRVCSNKVRLYKNPCIHQTWSGSLTTPSLLACHGVGVWGGVGERGRGGGGGSLT